MSDSVSLTQGQESLAVPSVNKVSGLSTYSSNPFGHLTSQFRGPFVYNETDEEKQKREEAEKKAKEDADKKSNFKRVQEKAESEEAARKAAEAKVEALEKEKAEREEAERKAAEQKLEEDKKFEELAKQREAEAKAKADEAAQEKSKREAAEAKLEEFEKQQQEEFEKLLEEIPEEKRPPLDDSMSITQKLNSVRHVLSLLDLGTKPPVGGTTAKEKTAADKDARLKELMKLQDERRLTNDELSELMELGE